MNRPLRTLVILTAAALAGTALPAFAEQLNLHAALTGGEAVPPNDSAGVGAVEATYDTDSNVLNYAVSYDGLTGEATAAHFHGPAAMGENAPPVVPVDGALASPITGTATLTDAQEADLLGGMWYFNVHTAQYPDGEIRGQVMQSMMSSESSMMSSESSKVDSSAMSSSVSSESSSVDVSASVSVSASASVDPSLSSASSDLSSAASSAVSDLSSAASSAVSDVSSAISSALDPSVSASVSTSVSASVSAP